MIINIKSFICVWILSICFNVAYGQDQSKTLVINQGAQYVVKSNNSLILDTLIMEDNAVLHFLPIVKGTLIVKTAIIGNNCFISSKGLTKFDGQNGGSLSLTIYFKELGSLIIDTSGGDGKNGRNGTNGHSGTPDRVENMPVYDNSGKLQTTIRRFIPGTPAIAGSPGSSGGSGGSGGDLELCYGTDNFIINFNNSKSSPNIMIKTNAGKRGIGGRSGYSGKSYNGQLINQPGGSSTAQRKKKPLDGKVILSMLNEQSL